MLTQRSFSLAVFTAIAVLSSAYTARATSVELTATPFTGSPTSVRIVLDDEVGGGDIRVSVTVNEGLADLRGVFLDVRDDVLFALSSIQATGEFVTGIKTNVIDLGHGANLNGGGTPCPCDIGVLLGTAGIGKDDIQSTSFVLSLTTGDLLDLSAFANQAIGVRVTSVGPEGGNRAGSSKLAGTIPDPTVPVPEPSPALLIAIGLGVLGYAGRRRRH
jgi:PEP-CTERM motif-containing protein